MTYVMSDIHGNMRRFNSVMEQINLQPEDTLYILGDVIDRHPDGLRILRKIMNKPNIKMLAGLAFLYNARISLFSQRKQEKKKKVKTLAQLACLLGLEK